MVSAFPFKSQSRLNFKIVVPSRMESNIPMLARLARSYIAITSMHARHSSGFLTVKFCRSAQAAQCSQHKILLLPPRAPCWRTVSNFSVLLINVGSFVRIPSTHLPRKTGPTTRSCARVGSTCVALHPTPRARTQRNCSKGAVRYESRSSTLYRLWKNADDSPLSVLVNFV